MAANSISSFFVGVPGGLVMSMIAFSIVFIVIAGLMFVMMGMEYLCKAVDGIGKKAPEASQTSAPVAPAAKAVAVSSGDEGELLAVITAAIAATCGAGARVLSFAPVKAPVASGWKFMSRVQNAEGFQD